MDEVKKLLYITYYYPPSSAVGAVRSAKLAKYLPRFGWEPIVLTTTASDQSGLPDRNVVRTRTPCYPAAGSGAPPLSPHCHSHRANALGHVVRGIRTVGRALLILPGARELAEEPFAWYYPAKHAAAAVCSTNTDISIVFSTYYPSTAHRVADFITNRTGIPWVAEFRDPWSQNPYHRSTQTPFLAPIGQRIERRALRRAQLLVGVSEPISNGLESLHQKKTACIESGYDPDDYIDEVPLTKNFTLTYTGNIYDGKRDPLELFKALKFMCEEVPSLAEAVHVRFIGGNAQSLLTEAVHNWGLADIVRFYPQVPFQDSVRLQRESSALLFLSWDDPRDQGTIPGKLFQYLGAHRPILAVSTYEQGSTARLLASSGCGVVANDAEHIRAVLGTWLREFGDQGRIRSHYAPDEDVLAKYTWENQARRLAVAFDSVLTKKGS